MELTQPEEEVLIQEQEDTETETQRPENVPKKFWNSESSEIRVDSLLHSYQALEKNCLKDPWRLKK
ncbi:MAG: hypothetical protein ACJAU6_003305 [Alphaproteobacteria bacterium]|jgi:hypothetical protein